MSATRPSARSRARFAAIILLVLLTAGAAAPAFAAEWTKAALPREMYSIGIPPKGEELEVRRGAERILQDEAGNMWASVRDSASGGDWNSAIYLLKAGASEWARADQGIDDAYSNEDWYVKDMVLLGDEAYVSTSEGVFARKPSESKWRQVGEFANPWVGDVCPFDGAVFGSDTQGIYRYDPGSGSWSPANDGLPAEAQLGGPWPFHTNFSASGDYLYVGIWDGSDADVGPRDPTLSKTGVYRWRKGGSSWEYVGQPTSPLDHGVTSAQLRQESVHWGPNWITVAGGHIVAQEWVRGDSVEESWYEWSVLDQATGQWKTAGTSPEFTEGWPFLAESSGFGAVISPDGRVVLMNNTSDENPETLEFDSFDPATNTWSKRQQRVSWWRGGLSVMEPFYLGDVLVLPAPAMAEPPKPPAGFVNSVPLPTEVSRDPEVIGTNAFLALAFALLFGFTSTVFNSTVKENYACISGWCAPITKLLRSTRQALFGHGAAEVAADGPVKRGVLGSIADKVPLRRVWQPLTIVLVSALVYGFLDPAFGLTIDALGLFLSLAIAIGVTTFAYEGLQALLMTRRYKADANLRLFPAAIAIAVACVVVSRVLAFHPGYVFGIVGGLAFATAVEPDMKSQGRAVFISSGVLLLVSLIAWFAAVPVSQAAQSGGGFWLTTAQSALVSIFVIGLEALLFGLFPIGFMDGEKVMRWSKAAWAVAFGVVAFAFWHVLLNKDSKYLDSLSQKNVQVMLVLLGVYGLLTLVTFLYFRSRNRAVAVPAAAGVPGAVAPQPVAYPAPVSPVPAAYPAPAAAPQAGAAPVAAAYPAPTAPAAAPQAAAPSPPAGTAARCRACGANVYVTPAWGCPHGHSWDQLEGWYDSKTGQAITPYWAAGSAAPGAV